MGVWDNRLGLDYTYWNRTVNDALIAKQFPLSGGFSRLQLANIGTLDAYGHDFKVNAFLVQRPTWTFDVFAGAAYIHQLITSMGGAPPLKVGGSYPRYRNFLKEGFAPGTLFGAALPGPCSARPAGATYTCLNAGDVPFDVCPIRTAIGGTACAAGTKVMATEAETAGLPRYGSHDGQPRPDPFDEDGDGDFLDHYLGKPYPGLEHDVRR